MAFTDPQTVTVNAVAQSCALISADVAKSIYAKDDDSYKLTISHQVSGNRTRRMVRLDHKITAADPLTAINSFQNLGIYLVIDEPSVGVFTDANIEKDVAGLTGWLTQANVLKVLTSQH